MNINPTVITTQPLACPECGSLNIWFGRYPAKHVASGGITSVRVYFVCGAGHGFALFFKRLEPEVGVGVTETVERQPTARERVAARAEAAAGVRP